MANKTPKQKPISKKQTRFLRGLGHHLSPLAMIGKEGITKTLASSVSDILTAHELMKVKMQNTCSLDKKEAAEAIARATGAVVAQVIGKTILLYRGNKDLPPEKQIKLP